MDLFTLVFAACLETDAKCEEPLIKRFTTEYKTEQLCLEAQIEHSISRSFKEFMDKEVRDHFDPLGGEQLVYFLGSGCMTTAQADEFFEAPNVDLVDKKTRDKYEGISDK